MLAAEPGEQPIHQQVKSVFGTVVAAAIKDRATTSPDFAARVKKQVSWPTGRKQKLWSSGTGGQVSTVASSAAAQQMSPSPRMVRVKGGCFEMGSGFGENDRQNDEETHEVCVRDFSIAKFETTRAEFERFVGVANYRTDGERNALGFTGCWGKQRQLG